MKQEVWSFFSGAMGLDLGLERAGIKPTLAVEFDKWCCASIRLNRPDVTLVEDDVRKQTGDGLRKKRKCDGDVFAIIGGPPCQSFSTGGKRAGLSDPRGNLIYEYLRIISEVKPQIFVLENVASLITAPLRHRPINERPGQKWNLSSYAEDHGADEAGNAPLEPDELAGSAIRQILEDVRLLGYDFRLQVVDASHYGAPQKRLRFILTGARNSPAPSLPSQSHGENAPGLMALVPLRDVIYDLRSNPGIHSCYTPEVAAFFNVIPPGGYWKHLPPNLQKKALGASFTSGGGKTGFFRRLSYDAPAPTVTTKPNRKGTAMCHPEFVRPISVRECARIQGFPDNWVFAGAMNQQYQQIGNAVPTHLGEAIGRAICATKAKRPVRVELPTRLDVELMLAHSTNFLRSYARNRVTAGGGPDLFSLA